MGTTYKPKNKVVAHYNLRGKDVKIWCVWCVCVCVRVSIFFWGSGAARFRGIFYFHVHLYSGVLRFWIPFSKDLLVFAYFFFDLFVTCPSPLPRLPLQQLVVFASAISGNQCPVEQ